MIHELYQKQFFKHESILFLLKSISEHHIIEEYLWDKYAKATSEEDKDIAYRKIIINKIDYALIAQPNFYNKLLYKEIISIEELQIALKDSWKILMQHWNKAIENYDKNLLCNISSD